MSVGLLIITHNKIGAELVATAEMILQKNPMPTIVMGVTGDCNVDNEKKQAAQAIEELNNGDGVLILTDIYGATPCNIANHFKLTPGVGIVTGLNLPMLLRILNYHQLPLNDLISKAASAGTDSVFKCE